jgi:hypothetical protein
MSDKGETSIKVIYFTGKSQGWRVWNKKFLARANRLGYKKLFLGEEAIPTEAEIQAINNRLALGLPNQVTANDETNLDLYQLNERAYEDLLLSIDGESNQGRVAFNLVENAVTPDHPEGNCKIDWDRLVNKYAPTSAPSYIQLKKEFANSKLKSAAHNPDDWITRISSSTVLR